MIRFLTRPTTVTCIGIGNTDIGDGGFKDTKPVGLPVCGHRESGLITISGVKNSSAFNTAFIILGENPLTIATESSSHSAGVP